MEITVPSMEDVLRGLPSVHTRALDKRRTISAQLEIEQPSDDVEVLASRGDYTDGDHGDDAFGRILDYTGIETNTNPAAGIYATEIGRVLNGEHVMPNGQKIGRAAGRAVGMIWAERIWRSVKYNMDANTRAMFTSNDDAIGDAMRPWSEDGTLRDELDRESRIPLSMLIAQETTIDDDAYKSVYVDETAVGTFDYKRVTEGAQIPTVYLRTSEQTIRLHKRGRAIDWTYEAARRMRFDKFRLIIQKMATDVEAGKLSEAFDVLINGDGNANTAATVVALTDMDPALTANDPISLRAMLRFKKEWRGAFMMTTILGNIEDIVDLEMTEVGLDNTPWIALPQGNSIGQLTPLNNQRTADQVGYADVDPGQIPAGKYLAFDRRYALERVSEVGASISEADDFISNQTSLLTFTDVDGFATIYPKATRILDTAV